ncbi:MAG: hypothetical protein HY016_01265 [Nitrosomonadales bacterium]|nr:hypothetical protein [Nitrosomonadales bacterium]
MIEKISVPPILIYVSRIIIGLIVLCLLAAAASELDLSDLSPLARMPLLGFLIATAIGIVPFARRVYRRMDELQKVLHQNACVSGLPIVAAASAAIGMLQLNGLLPEFNQFLTLGLIVCVWSFNLMRTDRQYK